MLVKIKAQCYSRKRHLLDNRINGKWILSIIYQTFTPITWLLQYKNANIVLKILSCRDVSCTCFYNNTNRWCMSIIIHTGLFIFTPIFYCCYHLNLGSKCNCCCSSENQCTGYQKTWFETFKTRNTASYKNIFNLSLGKSSFLLSRNIIFLRHLHRILKHQIKNHIYKITKSI